MALIDQVESKTKDDSGRLTYIDDYEPAIVAALERYSKARPADVVVDLTGDGSHDLALPANWVTEFSQVRRVEYPLGAVPATLLSRDRCTIYHTPAGPVLRLLDHIPAPGEQVRVTITVPRNEAQIIAGDADAVANLAASICCETLANLFAQTNDPTIAADVVNYRTKSAEFAARAKRLRQLYLDHIGLEADGGAPASALVASPPAADRTRLTHWRR